jgi:hypothetical protein
MGSTKFTARNLTFAGEKLAKWKDNGKTMKEYTVELCENNSDGRYRLKKEDWESLKAAGWVVGTSGGKTASLTVSAKNASFALRRAELSFEEATARCADETGCPCCGNPFQFSVR